MIDPIVEEIHRVREEYAAEFNFDVDAMFEDLNRKQSQSDRRIVSFAKDGKPKQDVDEKKVA